MVLGDLLKHVTLDNIIKALCVVTLVVLIVLMGVGVHVILNPEKCAEYGALLGRGQSHDQSGEQGEEYQVSRMQDIPRIPWDQPTNVNPKVPYPGDEGFYSTDTPESISMQDRILSTVISDDVKQNHTEYVNQTASAQPIAGASHHVIADHFTPPNQFVGLRKGTLYRQMGSMGDARTVESETAEQKRSYNRGGNSYTL